MAEEKKIKPRALLYDPYIDTMGGGERYFLTIAKALIDWGWNVEIAWTENDIVKQAQNRFNLDLTGAMSNPQMHNLFTRKSNLYARFQVLSKYDLIFVVSDGSIPILFGKKNFLHYQVPFTHINQSFFINKLKLSTISKIVVNSIFTKQVIDRTLGTHISTVLYPPVDVESFSPNTPKKNQILSVGRFASPSHSKRQDVLIKAFEKMVKDGLTGWKLVLAGGEKGADTVLGELKEQAGSLPIEFHINPSFDQLRKIYNESCIYWHAAGFEVDERLNPEAVEHFGITTVESMAAGNVPVVIARGGQKEIVTPQTGFLCEDLEEIVEHTHKLIKDKVLWTKMAEEAVIRSKDFGLDIFIANFQSLLND